MEQQGSLIVRLPFFTEKWGRKHRKHHASSSAQNWAQSAQDPRAAPASPVFPTKAGAGVLQPGRSLCSPGKGAVWLFPGCVCLWVSGTQREDRAALRSASVQAGFVNGPFVFLRCACKRRVKLSSSAKPSIWYLHIYIPTNYMFASSTWGKVCLEVKGKRSQMFQMDVPTGYVVW